MYKASNSYRRPAAIICLVMGVVLLVSLSACSRAPEDPAWFQSKTTGDPVDEGALINRINATDDIVVLFRMKEEYSSRGGEADAVNRALSERMDILASQGVPLGSPCPEVDLVAFDYRRPGPNRYYVDFLFRVNKQFKTNLAIGITGKVLAENRDQLSPKRRKAGKESESWSVKPDPPTSAWRPGEYVLVSSAINARPIAYNFQISFYDPAKQSGGQLYGDVVPLGWSRGLTEADLIEEINRAGNLIDLYRLAGDSRSSSSASSAFEKKSSQLLEDNPLVGKICPEADLVEFDFQKIGDKRYQVDYLFRVNQPLDKDCLIILSGVVDENHREFLSEKRRKMGKRSEIWSFRPYPRTKDWPSGEYVLVSNEIEAQPIPYDMHTSLYDRGGEQPHGERISLGWRADPGRVAPAAH